MPLQATSGAASYDAFGGGVPFEPTYIEQIFQTWLYTGNGSTQTITNGIDLAGKGGLVWLKSRSFTQSHGLFDTQRGEDPYISSDLTGAQINFGNGVVYNNNGFTNKAASFFGGSGAGSTANYVSWTFRKQPKFFDVVTWTGSNDVGTNTGKGIIPHSLGSAPGCVIIKNVTQGATNWIVYHRSLSGGYRVLLNTTDAQTNSGSAAYFSKYVDGVGWTQTDPDATNIYVGYNYQTNGNTDTLVAYVFAHNAGGFGLTGTDNVISCGAYTGNGSTNGPVVTIGYEPQWLLVKNASGEGDWRLYDSMRGLVVQPDSAGGGKLLLPNLSNSEADDQRFSPTATGFNVVSSGASVNTSGATYIYIAIRRGPMKVPTDATKVFAPIAATSSQGTENTTGFPLDMQIANIRSGFANNGVVPSRLTGVSSNTTSSGSFLRTPSTNAEQTGSDITQYWSNTGFQTASNWAGSGMAYWNFRRAPGFFDVVCYTGTGSALTLTHNLTVAPQMMFIKRRNGATSWHACFPSYLLGGRLNTADSLSLGSYVTATSATTFTVNTEADVNSSGATYVAYLFSTCTGVSKVGDYAGNGSSQVINCGFTGGARFVLIKNLFDSGNWYVWDSARGIVASNDPHLSLNTTAAEVTTDDSVDTDNSGFAINQNTATNINVNGQAYAFFAIS
jgi:hypothetical protein